MHQIEDLAGAWPRRHLLFLPPLRTILCSEFWFPLHRCQNHLGFGGHAKSRRKSLLGSSHARFLFLIAVTGRHGPPRSLPSSRIIAALGPRTRAQHLDFGLLNLFVGLLVTWCFSFEGGPR